MARPMAILRIFNVSHLNWQYHLTFRVYRRVKPKGFKG